jgi:hypothetical protein
MRYRVRPERLSATARWMDRVAAGWDARLAAIKRIAEAGEAGTGPATPEPRPASRPA